MNELTNDAHALWEYHEAIRAANAVEDEAIKDELLGMAEIDLRRRTGGLK